MNFDYITTVLIDIDDTLLDFNKCAENSMLAAANDLELELPENMFEIFTVINNRLWKEVEAKKLDIDGLYSIRWNIIFEKAGIDFDGILFERIFLEYLTKTAVPVDGACDMLKYLSDKYILCAASNAPYEQQRLRLEAAGMRKYFTHLFISEAMGAEKPNGDYFDACLEKLEDTDKNKLVIIGDSISADITGGINYGIKTIWFNKKGKTSDILPDAEIKDLSEIKKLL